MTDVITDRLETALEDLQTPGLVQGRGVLRRKLADGSDAWCCLGRLCEVYRKETGRGTWTLVGADNQNHYTFDSEVTDKGSPDIGSMLLPEAVQEFFGFSSGNPELVARTFTDTHGDTGTFMVAAGWNDHGATFAEIVSAFRDKYITQADDTQ